MTDSGEGWNLRIGGGGWGGWSVKGEARVRRSAGSSTPFPPPPHRPKAEPIERFSDEQFGFLIDKLLGDWDSPTLSELGLCRAHSITLEELDAITAYTDFQRALALVRRIRAKRRHEVEASARAALFDRLLRLVNQTSETTTATKEVRLACKQLTTFMESEEVGPTRRAESSTHSKDTEGELTHQAGSSKGSNEAPHVGPPHERGSPASPKLAPAEAAIHPAPSLTPQPTPPNHPSNPPDPRVHTRCPLSAKKEPRPANRARSEESGQFKPACKQPEVTVRRAD